MKKITQQLILLLVSFTGMSQTNIQDYDLIRDNLVNEYNRSIPEDAVIQDYIDTQLMTHPTDSEMIGSWSDIVYNVDVQTTKWTSREHLFRLKILSRAYSDANNILWYQNTDVLNAVYLGVDHWVLKDYQTSNFPGKTIYAQQDLITTFLNIEKVEPVLDKYNYHETTTGGVSKNPALKAIMDRAPKPNKYKNSNSAWRNETQVLIAMFTDDEALLINQINQIYQQYTQPSGEEGIQPDGSFHFHGNQFNPDGSTRTDGTGTYIVQFGNYGTSYIDNLDWLEIAAGTPYKFDVQANANTFEFIRNYFVDGISWTYWDDEMDYNLMPRTNDYNQTFDRANKGLRGKEIMIKADPSFASEYEKILTWPNQLTGFKSFWKSDLAIARTANWYASVRMNSTRVLRGESINGENQRGLHQSDGVLMFQQSGKEYENIGALWNWKMLPGVTCDQGINNLIHGHYNRVEALGETTYAGSIGTVNSRGMASMINKRVNLYAKKSWFFDEDVIVCLGSGIDGTGTTIIETINNDGNTITSEFTGTADDVFTTIQQSFNIGDAKDKNNTVLPAGETAMSANDWVYHDNAVYQSTTPFKVDVSFRQDNWSKLEAVKDQEDEGTIFSTWIDHGQSPANESYAYFIYPQADGTNIPDRISKRPTILVNTESVHAIEIDDRLYASFYEAGSVIASNGVVIQVDVPCLLAIDGDKIFVADPNHDKSSVLVKVDATDYNITFPTGDNQGRQEIVTAASSVLSLNKAGEIDKSLYLYPNPAKDTLFISGATEGAIARIFDVSGRETSTQKVISGKVNTANLVSGLYFILLENNGLEQTLKFVKE
ncbi:polysaccharide lyase family 8 super-sandwich domain-containing protein [Flavivirga amylovorans]|uniref:Polysaccharide lyase family 8 super-sandwich domain-containing protein n=1 Tax=Flavivirga amylovorans TaxID=870486 RepID=A0ABT8WWI1_9FLAO|nr:polysaccharide lyase family 8 super-sandwich domain-containing protein [Flavivirga amylovorans]MDO5985852.1 polysaccharide lyase family 8 super-sandwich domain-containing protein [Flavivirga amylovorans]